MSVVDTSPSRPAPSGTLRWYCAQALVRKEPLALQHLLRQGFEGFLPRIRKARRHARRFDTVLAPLFPGYLFVRLDPARQRWRAINGTIGIARLITAEEMPLAVPEGVVEVLLAASDGDGLFREERVERLCVNDRVRILHGPFAERMATVARLDDGDRVQLLLELMGWRRPGSPAAHRGAQEHLRTCWR